ncbi:MAG TPA: aldose 1-epimerase family protein [Gaiellaceae bacterium]|nr:aldose 1-epimerase family protein [Gaiellaceae bacterium]
MLAPSGEQLELALGEQRAVVVEVGGGLRVYEAGGGDLVDAYEATELSTSGRGQVLIPWPNRVQGGNYEFGGSRFQLALDEPSAGNAIHGLVRWVAWTVAEREASRVVVEHKLHPQPGYPFALALSIEYALTPAGLRVRTTATNVGPGPCPFGSGAHPYLTVGTAPVDSVLLQVPARTVLHADEHGTPTTRAPVDGTEYDFRHARPIGATRFDTAFTGLERDDDGLARVELRRPDGEGGLALWVDESYGYLMLYTGDDRPDVNRRSLAVEPMTCPPNAFRSGDDVIVLEPGGSFEGAWGISPL